MQVSDAGCCAIARITSLRTLNLKNCPSLTDECLAALTPLERLCHLRLQVYTLLKPFRGFQGLFSIFCPQHSEGLQVYPLAGLIATPLLGVSSVLRLGRPFSDMYSFLSGRHGAVYHVLVPAAPSQNAARSCVPEYTHLDICCGVLEDLLKAGGPAASPYAGPLHSAPHRKNCPWTCMVYIEGLGFRFKIGAQIGVLRGARPVAGLLAGEPAAERCCAQALRAHARAAAPGDLQLLAPHGRRADRPHRSHHPRPSGPLLLLAGARRDASSYSQWVMRSSCGRIFSLLRALPSSDLPAAPSGSGVLRRRCMKASTLL